MSRRGFTLVELLATIVIIAVIMGLVLPSATRVSKENKNKMCEAYQQMMVEYAMTSKYSNKFYIDLSELEELDKVKKDCDGYVTIDYNGEKPIYKAHLSCNDGCHTDDFVEPDARSNTRTIFAPNPKCKDNVIYNGTSQYLVSPGEGYALSNAKRINVGKQNVVANLVDKNVYAWEDHTQNELVIRDCEIKQREITVVAENHEFIYLNSVPTFTYKLENTVNVNGKVENPLSSGVTYTVKDSNGNVINVTSTTPVGTYTIVPNSSAKSNYKLKYQNGTLTIKPKPVVVTAKSDSKTYDGNALKNSACSFVTVPTGHTVTCTMASASTITNVGNIDNVIQNVIIKNSSGADVTSNFQITKNRGTLTINKRAATCTSLNDSKIYDGTALTKPGGSCTNLVSGHSATFTNTGTITNVGSTANTVSNVVIKNGNTVVTDNYNITKNTGTLTVNKRTLNVTAQDKEMWRSQSIPSLTVTYSNNVSGETPNYSGALTTSATPNSAVDTYPITAGTLALANNGKFLAGNYTMSFANGTLTIKDPCSQTTKKCGEYGNCSVTYTDETGTKTKSCQNYSNYVSNYKCGDTYYENTSCNGSSQRPSCNLVKKGSFYSNSIVECVSKPSSCSEAGRIYRVDEACGCRVQGACVYSGTLFNCQNNGSCPMKYSYTEYECVC